MSFRAKLLIVMLTVGLIPTIAVLILSSYLVGSTLERIGAAGLENSLESADSLIMQTQQSLGKLLESKIDSSIKSMNYEQLRIWLSAKALDLAFMAKGSGAILVFPDTIIAGTSRSLGVNLPRTGLSHLEISGRSFITYSDGDSVGQYGCGLLMPEGYGELGRSFSQAVRSAASLGMYKTFSLKVLATATIIALVFVLLLGVVISTLISRQLVKPLRELTSGAAAIGAGNLDHRVSVRGGDEFSRLAESFNSMALEIRVNQRKLLEAERLAAWREVARRIAHEIRNPLTPINIEIYRLERFLEGRDGHEDQLKSVEIVKGQIQSLQELAGQFSTFAKEPELRKVNCSLRDTIQNSLEVYRSHPQLTLESNIPDNIPTLQLDPQMLSRAIINLVKNSLEAVPENPRIAIAARCDNDIITLTIRDNGPGFPKEKLDRMDQPFITSKKTGSGLGLAIVKKIIEEHGGRIRFYNENGAVAEIKFRVTQVGD